MFTTDFLDKFNLFLADQVSLENRSTFVANLCYVLRIEATWNVS